MIRFVVAALLAFTIALPFQGASAVEKEKLLVEDLTKATVTVLAESNDSNRKDNLQPVFERYLDLPFIGRFVLGRKWKSLTDDEKRDYIAAFEDYIVSIYANRLAAYSGEQIEVQSAQSISKRDTLVNTSLLRSGKAPVAIDWRVRRKKDKVIDVVVEGISLAVSQREEFSTYLQSNNIAKLIDRLKEQSNR